MHHPEDASSRGERTTAGQHDLIETVIEHFAYVGPALVGSLLWLASMLLMGIRILISTP